MPVIYIVGGEVVILMKQELNAVKRNRGKHGRFKICKQKGEKVMLNTYNLEM